MLKIIKTLLRLSEESRKLISFAEKMKEFESSKEEFIDLCNEKHKEELNLKDYSVDPTIVELSFFDKTYYAIAKKEDRELKLLYLNGLNSNDPIILWSSRKKFDDINNKYCFEDIEFVKDKLNLYKKVKYQVQMNEVKKNATPIKIIPLNSDQIEKKIAIKKLTEC